MAGLIFFGIAGAWLWVAAKFGRTAARIFSKHGVSRFMGAAAFAVVAVLPFADEIVGRWQLRRLCTSEAIVWVHPNAATIIAARDKSGTRDRHGFMFPIREQSTEFVDAKSGEPFYRVKAFHTPGGFIMRAGLNMGGSTSCWPDRWAEPLRDLKIDELLKPGKA